MEWLWGVVTLGFTSCITGFFFLLRKVDKLTEDLLVFNKENIDKQAILVKLTHVENGVEDIKACLLGTYDKKGLITQVAEQKAVSDHNKTRIREIDLKGCLHQCPSSREEENK